MNKEQSIQRYKREIQTWLSRAAMAYQSKNDDLSKTALEKRWQYQQKLAEVEGIDPPEKPKDPTEVFRGLDRKLPDWDELANVKFDLSSLRWIHRD